MYFIWKTFNPQSEKLTFFFPWFILERSDIIRKTSSESGFLLTFKTVLSFICQVLAKWQIYMHLKGDEGIWSGHNWQWILVGVDF